MAGEPQTRVVQSVDWNPKNAQPHTETVLAFSNCEQVELFLNGVSLGSQTRPADDSPRSWQVQYQPGKLRAVAKNRGTIAADCELRTAEKSARIALSVDRTTLAPGWDNVAYVTASILDDHNTVNPMAADEIAFQIQGPATIVAVESSDPASHESFQAVQHQAFRGRCVAILRATASKGEIKITATAPGLASDTVKLAAGHPH
jgi:beta-galactosidase